MKKTITVTVMAKDADGTMAVLYATTNVEWAALDVRDVLKMKDFFPTEVFEISLSNDNPPRYLRQGCKVDFAYRLT